jgi:WD40 repeat protein
MRAVRQSDLPTATPIPTATPNPATPIQLPDHEPERLPDMPMFLSGDGFTLDGTNGRLAPGFVGSYEPSPDGRFYAIGDSTGIRVYEADSLRPVWGQLTGEGISALSYSADGRRIATLIDHTIHIWNTESGELQRAFSKEGGFRSSLAWAPHNSTLLAIRWEEDLELWDVQTNMLLFTLAVQDGGGGPLAWSSDGSLLAEANTHHPGKGSTITIWNPVTGQPLHALEADFSVNDIQFSPDGSTLAATYGHIGYDTAFAPGTATVWDVDTGARLHDFNADSMWNADFSPDSNNLFVSAHSVYGADSPSGEVHVWDVRSGETVRVLQPPFNFDDRLYVNQAAWSPDGALIAASLGSRVAVWDAATGEGLSVFEGAEDTLRWTSDSQSLAAGPYLWDARSGRLIHELATQPGPGQITTLAWSPDGTQLATPQHIWDLDTLQPVVQLSTELVDVFWPIRSMAYLPDGTSLAIASGGSSEDIEILELFDPSTGARIATLEYRDHNNPWLAVFDVAWSPDGSQLAFATQQEVAIWDLQTLEQVHSWAHPAYSVAWSPDGRLLASGGTEGVIVRDIATDEALYTFGPPTSEYGIDDQINVVEWSPDGSMLAGGNGAFIGDSSYVIVWDMHTGGQIYILEGHEQPITSLSWSPDAALLASGSGAAPNEFGAHGYDHGTFNGMVLVWDALTGERVAHLQGHTAEVQAVAFSSDSSLLASGSADGTVIFWDVAQFPSQ